MHKISVLINTYNEEKNIRNCLDTVKWADEVVIVDMHSEDNTLTIAKEYGNVKIFYFEKCGYADPAREYAFKQASHDWVLVLDADEMISSTLYKTIKKIIVTDSCDVVYIPRQNYMFGEEILCGDWGVEVISRLMKKSSVVGFDSSIHSQFYLFNDNACKRTISRHDGMIIHFNYIDVEHFLEKMNRYTTIEAKNVFNGLKPHVGKWKIILAAFLFVPKFMIQQKGYKNKFTGLLLAVFMLNYHFSRYVKYKLMKKFNTMDTNVAIRNLYNDIAKKTLDEYKA